MINKRIRFMSFVLDNIPRDIPIQQTIKGLLDVVAGLIALSFREEPQEKILEAIKVYIGKRMTYYKNRQEQENN